MEIKTRLLQIPGDYETLTSSNKNSIVALQTKSGHLVEIIKLVRSSPDELPWMVSLVKTNQNLRKFVKVLGEPVLCQVQTLAQAYDIAGMFVEKCETLLP